MMRILRKVLDRLRSGEARDRDIDRLAHRVSELREASKRRGAAWQEKRAAFKRAEDRLKRTSARFSRRALSPDVVHDLLPFRARTVRARAAHADADRHDARLQEISAAYRDALAGAAHPRADVAATALQGLTWWVPVPPSLDGKTRDRFIAEQQFPYRSITQTREFSVGPVLLDIGANIGQTSIPRVILGDVERAYCAEPDPLNFAALVRNVASNDLRGLVLPDQVAIGAVTGPMRLQRAKYPGGHALVPPQQAGTCAIDVACCTLDDWCRRLSINPELVAYVKVDVQGWEAHVLRGASALIGYPHVAWQLEVHPPSLEAAGTPAGVLYEICAERFTHFIDLDKEAQGARARPTRELPDALTYLNGRKKPTDIVVFNASERLDRRMSLWLKRWGTSGKATED